MYSFSTCWNSHRHTDGRAMLREVRELGFEFAELSHGTRISLVPGILEAVDAGEIRISTVHNFCPLPLGVNHAAPNLFQFSDERPRERELAERYTFKTIEFAARVKAQLVVLHSGSIEIKDYEAKLMEMLARGEKDSPKYQKLCAEFDEKREAKKEKYLARTIESLRKVLPAAEAAGIKLGIENREGLEELPFESDYWTLFQEITSPNLAYWHDTGHAQIKENMGFIMHAMHLESMADRLAGFHIHDVQFPGRDHCAPGTGMIDYAALKPMVKPEHIKVFELSPKLPVEEVRKGVAHLKSMWGDE
ncbi:MAG TPA: sugar phosphate isomerase/epimerase family protein [Verrucomicrobiae bacterium]|nr:sugar phosphate isomerase/epimerase family protein [Verrucomicrobiae bacterium]